MTPKTITPSGQGSGRLLRLLPVPAVFSLLLGAACTDTTLPAQPVAPTPAPAAAAKEPVLDAAGKARVEARLNELEPEFWTRRARDGEQKANEWLRQKAVEISREEARRGAG